MSLFGGGSSIKYKKTSTSIKLELWDQKKQYDRIGVDVNTLKIMDVEIPETTIPIRPGRNLAVIIEVAAMNFRLKRMGVNAAEEFTDRLTQVIETEGKKYHEGVSVLTCTAPGLDRVFIQVGSLSIYWYGVIIAVGAFLVLYLATKEADRLGLKQDLMVDLLVFAIPIAILFARDRKSVV